MTTGRRSVAALAFTVGLIVGCSDSSGPEDDGVFGTYTLQSIDGQSVPLPALFLGDGAGGGTWTWLDRGSLLLSRDSVCKFQYTNLSTSTSSPGDTTEHVFTRLGVFTYSTDSIHIFVSDPSETPWMRGGITGDILTIVRQIPQPAPVSEETTVWKR